MIRHNLPLLLSAATRTLRRPPAPGPGRQQPIGLDRRAPYMTEGGPSAWADARPVYDGGQRVSKGNGGYSRRLFRFWGRGARTSPTTVLRRGCVAQVWHFVGVSCPHRAARERGPYVTVAVVGGPCPRGTRMYIYLRHCGHGPRQADPKDL